MFASFRSEINKNIVSDQKNQLDILESAISLRTEEVTSIAYNVGQDTMFYIEPVSGVKYSGYEMASALSRYLIGNRFIEHIAFYRLSEPDTIFTSDGQLSFHRFWASYLTCDNYTEQSFLEKIKTQHGAQLLRLSGKQGVTYFAYVCPLPQFSVKPLAFVIALIPYPEIAEHLSVPLVNTQGTIIVYDAKGNVIDSVSTLEGELSLSLPQERAQYTRSEIKADGQTYSVQSKTSSVNSWTYVSAVHLNGFLSELAGAQVHVIIALILLMIAAVLVVLLGVIKKYLPINKLAMTLTDSAAQGENGEMVDEKTLLSSTIETLRSDSEQKQMFEEAYHEANEASRAKSAFLSNMSHDIRTPMNAVIGMIGLAQKHINDKPYVKDCLQKANVASHYLLELINNVLDMSRIESGKITLSEGVIRLPELIYGLVTIANSNAGQKKQRMIVDTDAIRNEEIIGDNLRLTQVCMNILSNAIKFTPDGGVIRIGIHQRATETQGVGEYIFVFADAGIGIAPDFVKEVFDPFSRASDGKTSKIEGTGLGMAIAKNLVDMMGGSIRCESELGEGTTFTVNLPMRFAPDEPRGEDVSFEGSSVLIVCDDDDVRRHQAELFESLGFSADGVAAVGEAADRLEQARRDGAPYDYALINLAQEGKDAARAVADLVRRESEVGTRVMLAASEFSVVDNAVSGGADSAIYIRTPLFHSAVVSALTQKEDSSGTGEDAADVDMEMKGKKVLLVEDNEMNRYIARTILTEAGVEVTEGKNGREAVDIFKERPVGYFDVILMDVQMPEMDGLEATAIIRSMDRPDAANIPIFAMTANTFDEDVREVMRAGMSGHLGKPYSPEELFAVLRKAIR